jgi:protein TonB
LSARLGRTAFVVLALSILEPARAQSSAPSAEVTAFLGALRATLNANKRYPTGREAVIACPQGRARVHFTLDRRGLLRGSGIDQSSGSPFLDQAALATVVRATFPTPPPDAWDGPEHTFSVELDFQPGDICDPTTPEPPNQQPAPR